MLYRIRNAVAHPDHTVTVTWSDGVEAMVDLSPVIAKGNVFAPLQDGHYFAANMRIADDRLGLEWPNRVDFSADGLRFRAFPDEEKVEFEGGGFRVEHGGGQRRRITTTRRADAPVLPHTTLQTLLGRLVPHVGLLQAAAVLEIGGDPGRPDAVVSGLGLGRYSG